MKKPRCGEPQRGLSAFEGREGLEACACQAKCCQSAGFAGHGVGKLLACHDSVQVHFATGEKASDGFHGNVST